MIVEQMLKNAQTPLLHIADVSGSALFNADCMDILPLIPDKSIDVCISDPPYGLINDFDFVENVIKECERISNTQIYIIKVLPINGKNIHSKFITNLSNTSRSCEKLY